MSSAAPQKCTKLASVVGASAATSSHAASRCQVCRAAALRRCIPHAATQTCALWQAVRRDEIAGREHIGTDQFQWGAQLPAPHLCVLAIPPIEHVLTAAGSRGLSAQLTGLSGHLVHVRRRSLALPIRGRSGAHSDVREAIRGAAKPTHC